MDSSSSKISPARTHFRHCDANNGSPVGSTLTAADKHSGAVITHCVLSWVHVELADNVHANVDLPTLPLESDPAPPPAGCTGATSHPALAYVHVLASTPKDTVNARLISCSDDYQRALPHSRWYITTNISTLLPGRANVVRMADALG